MLKKQDRVRLEAEYKSILKNGRRFYSKYFLLIIKPSSIENNTRFGFIASKKVGNAVVRNTVKRKIREIVRLQLRNIKKGYDCVVILSPNSTEIDYKTLEYSIMQIFKKADLLS